MSRETRSRLSKLEQQGNPEENLPVLFCWEDLDEDGIFYIPNDELLPQHRKPETPGHPGESRYTLAELSELEQDYRLFTVGVYRGKFGEQPPAERKGQASEHIGGLAKAYRLLMDDPGQSKPAGE